MFLEDAPRKEIDSLESEILLGVCVFNIERNGWRNTSLKLPDDVLVELLDLSLPFRAIYIQSDILLCILETDVIENLCSEVVVGMCFATRKLLICLAFIE